MELAYALVGEQLDVGDDICGAGMSIASLLEETSLHPHLDNTDIDNALFFFSVLSRRPKADRLAVWVRDKENVEAINGIG